MRLKIRHQTHYRYDSPVPYGLQQLRLRPKSHGNQQVIDWSLTTEGGSRQLGFEDEHRNNVDLVALDAGAQEVSVACEGIVEIADNHGITGTHAGYLPLWLFLRQTPLTRPGAGVRRILGALGEAESPLDRLHRLSAALREAIRYESGVSQVGWTAEDAITAGHGVCQDHSHAFLVCARALSVPARYVSGYLLIDGQVRQDATHAWAEAHVDGLGWVGFDIANGIAPDTRYVRVATGLDYTEAAPVSGLRLGSAAEELSVAVEVEIQQQ